MNYHNPITYRKNLCWICDLYHLSFPNSCITCYPLISICLLIWGNHLIVILARFLRTPTFLSTKGYASKCTSFCFACSRRGRYMHSLLCVVRITFLGFQPVISKPQCSDFVVVPRLTFWHMLTWMVELQIFVQR